MKPGYTGVTRILWATRYSLQGLAAAWRHEPAFRQELALVAVLLPLAFVMGAPGPERALLVAAALQVLVIELLNTGIETAIDRMGDGHHDLSARAKDLGSAAVMLSLVLAGATWGLVLLE